MPSIAHFCSLFRAAFNLLDFDIEVSNYGECSLLEKKKRCKKLEDNHSIEKEKNKKNNASNSLLAKQCPSALVHLYPRLCAKPNAIPGIPMFAFPALFLIAETLLFTHSFLFYYLQDLEEALLTDGGTEGRLLQELIVRLLEGCLPNDTRNDISTFNYQMFLRRLFRKKCQVRGFFFLSLFAHFVLERSCQFLNSSTPNDFFKGLFNFLNHLQEYKCENPFNTDVDFECLPLRQKVEILRALCDFRLDAEDVVHKNDQSLLFFRSKYKFALVFVLFELEMIYWRGS